MDFKAFFKRCQEEPSVSDFESYLARCIFEKGGASHHACTLEAYSLARDQAFDRRDEKAAQFLYELAGVEKWEEGEWEGALK